MQERPGLLKVLSLIALVTVATAGIVAVGGDFIGLHFYTPPLVAPAGTIAADTSNVALFSLPMGTHPLPGGRLAIALADTTIVIDSVGVARPERRGSDTQQARGADSVVLLCRVPGGDTIMNGRHAVLFTVPEWFPALRERLGCGLISNVTSASEARLLIRYHIRSGAVPGRIATGGVAAGTAAAGDSGKHTASAREGTARDTAHHTATGRDTAVHTASATHGPAAGDSARAAAGGPAAGHTSALAIEFGNPVWAFTWGVVANVLALAIVWGMFVRHRKNSGELPPCTVPNLLKHMAWFPMRLTLTASGTYSLAAFQMLIWTVVVFFGLNFVWKMTQSWLEITQQVLLLLGIGGGTAVLKRITYNARMQNVPAEMHYLVGHDGDGSGASLFDLVSEDNTPNIVKMQMLMFTLFAAGVVVRSICIEYAFPHLSDGLITLFGLSSAVFVGGGAVSTVSADQMKQEAEKMKSTGAKDARATEKDARMAEEEPGAGPVRKADEDAYRKLLRQYLNV